MKAELVEDENTLPEAAAFGYIRCSWVDSRDTWIDGELGDLQCRAFLPGRTLEFTEHDDREIAERVAEFLSEYASNWHVSAQARLRVKLYIDFEADDYVFWLAQS